MTHAAHLRLPGSTTEHPQMTADDPDYSARDLLTAIKKGDYPKWTVSIQVMRELEAEKYKWNPFDLEARGRRQWQGEFECQVQRGRSYQWCDRGPPTGSSESAGKETPEGTLGSGVG